ncbi:hypothetical protein, partial [Mesorhizobium sp. P5_C1]
MVLSTQNTTLATTPRKRDAPILLPLIAFDHRRVQPAAELPGSSTTLRSHHIMPEGSATMTSG